MGLEISNATPTVLIQSGPNFMINKAVIRVYKVMDILAIYQKLRISWHFEMFTWESMGKVKCGISRKRIIVERNGRNKIRTLGTTVRICRVFFMPN